MKANDDFLGSSSGSGGGRRMHYDINDTIDDSFEQEEPDQIVEDTIPIIEKTIPENTQVYHAKPKYEVNSDNDSEDEYEIDSYEFSDEDEDKVKNLNKSPGSSSSGGLSELSNEQNYFINKMIYQKRALFHKNVSLQLRAKKTNCVQLLMPLSGLALLWLIGKVGQDDLGSLVDHTIFIPFPYLFGLNYKPISSAIGDQGLIVTNCDKWFFTDWAPDVTQKTKEYWGFNTGENWSHASNGGIIDGSKNVLTSPCSQVEKNVPYFKDWQTENKKLSNKYEDIDAFLFEHLTNLANTEISYVDRNLDYNKDVKAMPDVVYTVKEANDKVLSYDSKIMDHHLWQYHKNDGLTKLGLGSGKKKGRFEMLRINEGNLEAAHIINKAYIKHQFNTTVMTGVNIFPFVFNLPEAIKKTQDMLGTFIIPLCMMMGYPMFLFNIVNEKEKRLIEIMKINGLKMINYWIVTFTFNYVFTAIVYIFFVFMGKYFFEMSFFQKTNIWVTILIFNGWILAQISWAFLTSIFIQKSLTASLVGYIVAIYSMIMADLLSMVVYVMPLNLPWYYHFIPTFSFTRAVNYACEQCMFYNCYHSLSEIVDVEARVCIAMLYVQFIVYGFLAWYLNQVIPQQHGVAKKWNFLCQKKKRNIGMTYDYDEIGDLEEDRETHQTPVYDYETSLEDADSKAERNTVYNLDKADYYKYPLIIKDLRKEYKGFGGRSNKAATKNMTLRIKKGEMFGMLGPNGAGKTTLISMLTGLFEPSRGNAWVAGFDIKHQLEAVQLQIGFCPQFDILWPNMTVKEHLLFYARIKGISPLKEEEMVTKAIEDVLLQEKTDSMVQTLSGGQKRRLSVAISIVSDPKIIYLDEPTTGLDPENRRQLWDILVKLKGKRAVVLTTHSMEEADVLCNRIAIINQGILRCVASQARLKTLYGGGYHLQVNCVKQRFLNITRKLEKREARKSSKNRQRRKQFQNNLEIRSHPSQNANEEEEEEPEQINSSSLEQEQDQEVGVTIEEIHKNVQTFILQNIPQAEMISEFNGNFVYLIPQSKAYGFNPSRIFTQFEANKARLYISDWGLSQSSLDDVFTKICEQNGDNNA